MGRVANINRNISVRSQELTDLDFNIEELMSQLNLKNPASGGEDISMVVSIKEALKVLKRQTIEMGIQAEVMASLLMVKRLESRSVNNEKARRKNHSISKKEAGDNMSTDDDFDD